MSNTPSIYVVIPAAGIGSRMQADMPKQYLPIKGKTVLEHTLECFLPLPEIKQVIVALNPADQHFHQLIVNQHPKLVTVNGGKERADSVLAGLMAIDEQNAWVMVHDAARPCLPYKDIESLFETVRKELGAILATPVRDTMKRTDNEAKVLNTEDRENLWHALTPQCFAVRELKAALKKALDEGATVTDEASAIEYCAGSVHLIDASAQNIKITQPDDLLLAEFYLSAKE